MARKRLIFLYRSYTFLKQIRNKSLAQIKKYSQQSPLSKGGSQILYPFHKDKYIRIYLPASAFICRLKTKVKTLINHPANLFLLLITSGFLILGMPEILTAAQTPKAILISQNQTTLIDQGKALYDAEKYTEAATILQQAAANFKTQGNPLKQAVSLSNLSSAYQQLGLWNEAETAISESLKILQSQQSSNTTKILAQTLDIQGRLQLSLGQAELALETWQQAAKTYEQAGDKLGKIGSSLNQAQALQTLGFYRRALTTLTEVTTSLETQPNSLLKATALRSYGDVLQLVGRIKESQTALNQSLEIAKTLQSPADISAALFSLGNTTRAQQQQKNNKKQTTQNALKFYQDAANLTRSPTLKIRAQLNQLSLLIETKQLAQFQSLLPEIKAQIPRLAPNQTAVHARINLAQSLLKLPTPEMKEAAEQLSQAVGLAKSIKDQRAEAYAQGNLAALYEQTGQLNIAKELTNQALVLAQTINASDIAYRWQWQLARILKAQGDKDGTLPPSVRKDSIAAYESAVQTLKSLRGDLVSVNPDVQFSFRESVEPVYREYVALLLQPQGTDKDVAKARDVIESLQVAELVNFFREDCLSGSTVNIDTVDQQAAVVYPIVLKDRLEVVVSLRYQPPRSYSTRLPQAEVEKVFTQLREAIAPNTVNPTRGIPVPESLQAVLSPFIDTTNRNGPLLIVRPDTDASRPVAPLDYLPLAQKVYDWLIRPVEKEIAANKTQTLVFVLDGALLNLPMAVLHDGNQFLVEKYAIALTPGLQLLDAKKPLPRVNLTALKGGLSQARDIFPALPNVKTELTQIQTEAKVGGEELLDENFTSAAIQKSIDSIPFPIVHLATHGKFSSNAEETFLLAWDKRLNVNELNSVLRSREEGGKGAIELLVLSACQTAAGDKRAALGLAGVAVKAGARSTVATLWFVSDEATAKLMTRFYQELANTTITKAEALRRAQVSLLKTSNYQKPIYWAPYVMIGNWL